MQPIKKQGSGAENSPERWSYDLYAKIKALEA